MQAVSYEKSHQLAYQSKLRDCKICKDILEGGPEAARKMRSEDITALHEKHYELMTDAQIDASEQNLVF